MLYRWARGGQPVTRNIASIFVHGNANTRATFGAGCDARLAGQPLHSCPHEASSVQARQWEAGWKDVDKHWGTDTRRPINPLPPVDSFF
jgi:hypothetical protein